MFDSGVAMTTHDNDIRLLFGCNSKNAGRDETHRNLGLNRDTAQWIRPGPTRQVALGHGQVYLSDGLNKNGLGRGRRRRHRFGTHHAHQDYGATGGTSQACSNRKCPLGTLGTIERNKYSLKHIYTPLWIDISIALS